MKGCTGPITGRSRLTRLRSGGSALANAWRTIRRCTPELGATALDRSRPRTRTPCESARTAPPLALRSIPASRLFGRMLGPAGWANLQHQKGPFYTIEISAFSALNLFCPLLVCHLPPRGLFDPCTIGGSISKGSKILVPSCRWRR
jgi:hypothetical protein